MNSEQIEYMVQRFLAWKLPDDIHPDGGLSVMHVANPGTAHEYRLEPIGTNLLNYTQALDMVLHLIDGLPDTAGPELKREPLRAILELCDRDSEIGSICLAALGLPEPDRTPIPDRSALGPHGDEEPVHRLDLPPPTPAMEAKASEIARRYGGGAIPHYAALAGLIEGKGLPPALARPNRTSWGLEAVPVFPEDPLATKRPPYDQFGGFGAMDPKNYRTAALEVIEGFEVAAYREPHPEHGTKYGHRYSEHWSTPNWKHPDVRVERLFTEAQLRAALDDVPARLEIKRLRQGIALLANRISVEGSAYDQAIRAVGQMVLDVKKAARDLLTTNAESGK